MATTTRQPFAPLDGARLQSLTSLKNRQNANSPVSNSKRKSELLQSDDFENVDPALFAKRSKSNSGAACKDILKPTNFFLATKAIKPATITPFSDRSLLASPTKSTSAIRRTLQPKSPIKLNTRVSKPSPIATTPAGRTPTHGKRSGILSSRRRTAGPYTRVDPPAFSLGSAAPFSLDAALKGTISGYASRSPLTPTPAPASKPMPASLDESDTKASWFFDIHEDTPEQEMTNLLQHGTCVLDISSDEEAELKQRRDRDEGRDKENVPPVDDVSQTSSRRITRANADDMIVEKERVALGEMNTADFYPEGCDESSVILILEDDEVPKESQRVSVPKVLEVPAQIPTVPALPALAVDVHEDIDALMSKSDATSSKAAVLQPIEGTGDSFVLWESSSAKDDAGTEPVVASS